MRVSIQAALGVALVFVLGCATGEQREPLFSGDPHAVAMRTAEYRDTVVQAALSRAEALEKNATNHVDAIEASVATGEPVWWEGLVGGDLDPSRENKLAPLSSFYEKAIQHSSQIRVFSHIPLIRQTGIDEARGRFVPRAFAEGKYENRNEPVGSTLTTGSDGRFKEISRSLEYGLRKRFRTGAEATVSHRLQSVKSNSVFFVPDPQTTSRLAVSIVQPLLRGAGTNYNLGIRDLALIDTEVAKHEFVRQVESHLVEITRSYWNAYLSRALYLQKQKLVQETQKLVGRLENRAGIDAGKVQLIRSRAALLGREADLIRASISIENASNRLRALVNAPDLDGRGTIEIVPTDTPHAHYGAVDLATVISEAVQRRPEVHQAYLQYEAAALRAGMSRNESRWLLDLILEGSYSGLSEEDYRAGPAVQDGFNANGGVVVGLRFEAPLGWDESAARRERRAIELRQQKSQVQTTLNTIVLEAQISVAEYASAAAEESHRRSAVEASLRSYETLRSRWQDGLGGTNGVSMLEHLLDAQELLSEAEESYVTAQVGKMVAIANLERAKGNFLGHQRLAAVQVRKSGELPEIFVESQP